MIDPKTVCFYIPPELQKTKLALFERIASHICGLGGQVTGEWTDLDKLPSETIPIVGCSPQLTPMIARWRESGRTWIYWDRGYARRCYATWLARGSDGGYYRWHVNAFQMQTVREVPPDRWNALGQACEGWHENGKHILIARPSKTYLAFHGIKHWTDETIYALSLVTDRQLVVRDKESKRPLAEDLAGCHACISHGSNAAVEAVILGYPVFVDPISAAALVGKTDLTEIEKPIRPNRKPWVYALAYSQFNEKELCDGTLWRLLQ